MIRYNIDCPGRSSLIHSPVTHIRCAAETYATKHCALKIFLNVKAAAVSTAQRFS